MNDLESRTRRYALQLLRFAQCVPRRDDCFLHTLQNAAYVVTVTDSSGLLIHVATEAKLEVGDGHGGVIPAGTPEETRFIAIHGSIERVMFPGISSTNGPAGLTVGSRWTVIQGVAFASPQFATRHWADAPFYRHCAEELPLRVTATGDVLGVDLLYGWEEHEKAQSRLLEIVRIFGSSDMLPADDHSIEDLAWNDFSHGFPGRGVQQPAWSFARFLKTLEAPANETVLLLGSYHTGESFDEAAGALNELGYRTFALRDAPDISFQTNTEKFLAGVMCSAFVVVVDTHPSGHFSELTHLLDLRLRPVIVLRHEASPPSWFQDDRIRTDDLFRVVVQSEFCARSLAEHVQWARATMMDRVKKLNAVNHWRELPR